jgi:hypothetical protein
VVDDELFVGTAARTVPPVSCKDLQAKLSPCGQSQTAFVAAAEPQPSLPTGPDIAARQRARRCSHSLMVGYRERVSADCASQRNWWLSITSAFPRAKAGLAFAEITMEWLATFLAHDELRMGQPSFVGARPRAVFSWVSFGLLRQFEDEFLCAGRALAGFISRWVSVPRSILVASFTAIKYACLVPTKLRLCWDEASVATYTSLHSFSIA